MKKARAQRKSERNRRRKEEAGRKRQRGSPNHWRRAEADGQIEGQKSLQRKPRSEGTDSGARLIWSTHDEHAGCTYGPPAGQCLLTDTDVKIAVSICMRPEGKTTGWHRRACSAVSYSLGILFEEEPDRRGGRKKTRLPPSDKKSPARECASPRGPQLPRPKRKRNGAGTQHAYVHIHT